MSDIFVLPSVSEAWGIVVNEAMNYGLAIITSNKVGSAADLVFEGENGFTYPVGDHQELSEKLSTILGNPQLLDAMGLKSKNIIAGWDYEKDLDGFIAALEYVSKRC